MQDDRSSAALERAAQTLAAIARIESLQGGIVEFEAEGLAGGWWYEAEEIRGELSRVWVPVPPLGDDLVATARRFVEQGVQDRESELAEHERLRAEWAQRPPPAGDWFERMRREAEEKFG